MARYIDVDVLLADIKNTVIFSTRGAIGSPEIRGANKVINRIKAQPTADVEEAVRCKDCKKAIPLIFKEFFFCRRHRACRKANDFCSYGEKKDFKE